MTEYATSQQNYAEPIVDVRSELERGDEPFARIMETAEALRRGESFVIIAPFEPVPLYQALASHGFMHETERVAADEWLVRFIRNPE